MGSMRQLLALALFTFLLHIIDVKSASKPNIVFFLTDDQDITLGGMSMMPKTTKLMTEQGLTFNNAFVHSPICCISRASFLSGRYVHNHHTINNTVAGNCDGPNWRTNTEPHCYAPHVLSEGYNTFYAGKYLNTYGFSGNEGTAWIPKGWNNWYGLVGNSRYYGESISNNGTTQTYGQNYITDYYTNVLRDQSLSYLDLQSNDKPFLLVVATPAAHAPFEPAPQYNNTAQGLEAPRTPNWNNVKVNNANKHQLMGVVPDMDSTMISQSDQTWRFRLGTLKSVDDLVEAVFDKITNEMDPSVLNNTYFIYTSDHGFHLGQYGMAYDKRQLYENDIRIPFVIRGPGVPAGKTTDQFALNIDIAPTIVDIATGKIPADFDGMSLVPYLNEDTVSNLKESNKNQATANQQFLIEYYGEQYNANTGISTCGGYPGFEATVCDMWNNSYHCVRTINTTQNEVNGTIYCVFQCYDNSHVEIGCDSKTVQGQGEYYNLDKDYFEINNIWSTLNGNQVTEFQSMIDNFMKCAGQTQCNQLRLTDENERKFYFDYIKDKLIYRLT